MNKASLRVAGDTLSSRSTPAPTSNMSASSQAPFLGSQEVFRALFLLAAVLSFKSDRIDESFL